MLRVLPRLFLSSSAARPGFAVADDVEEQLFERERRVIDLDQFPAVAGDDRPNFVLARLRKAAGLELGDVLHREQLAHAAQLLQLALMQDRNPIADVLDIAKHPWPFEDGSVAEAYSSHCVEHLNAVERCHFFNELYRVLTPGATAKIITPHWSTCRAYGDPTHAWPPIGEFFFMYLRRDWRLGTRNGTFRANAPHTDVMYWPLGYACDFEVTDIQYGVNAQLATRPEAFRQFAENHYREFIYYIIVTLTKRHG